MNKYWYLAMIVLVAGMTFVSTLDVVSALNKAIILVWTVSYGAILSLSAENEKRANQARD